MARVGRKIDLMIILSRTYEEDGYDVEISHITGKRKGREISEARLGKIEESIGQDDLLQMAHDDYERAYDEYIDHEIDEAKMDRTERGR